MGDDTWMQLAKDAFTEAYPYPSFDVHDLHTVDNGVWEVRWALLQTWGIECPALKHSQQSSQHQCGVQPW